MFGSAGPRLDRRERVAVSLYGPALPAEPSFRGIAIHREPEQVSD